MAKAYIGLGANLGEREPNIRRALALIGEMNVGRVRRVSGLIETDPVGGPPGQGCYLNAAALLETELSPGELLDSLKIIEKLVGRIERERWGPREVDLDILLYDDVVMETDRLRIPHARLCERGFVLRPLAQIAPEVVHPVCEKTVAELLLEIESTAK